MSKYFIKGRLNSSMTGCDFDHANIFKRVLNGWEDKDLEITIQVYRKNRSNAQNRYWHGVMIARIINFYKETEGETYTIDQVKAHIYKNVLLQKVVIVELEGMGVVTFDGKPMSKQNTVEFNDSKKLIQEYYAKRGCDIPDPREDNFATDYINANQ